MNDCIEWQHAKVRGYGVRRSHGKQKYVHRLAWEEAYGPIPDGLCVLHRCDNPPCYNVDHLFLGTKSENARDRDAKGRHAHGDNSPTRKYPGLLAGTRNGRALLTEADIPVIRYALAAGAHGTDLARVYGVHSSTIYNIASGTTWRHVA